MILWEKFGGRGCFLVSLFKQFTTFYVDALTANHEKEDWISGEKTEDVVAFLDRLYTAKRTVEQRIVVLGGEDSVSGSTGFITFAYAEKHRSQLPLQNLVRGPKSLYVIS
jgi:sorting nexin-25